MSYTDILATDIIVGLEKDMANHLSVVDQTRLARNRVVANCIEAELTAKAIKEGVMVKGFKVRGRDMEGRFVSVDPGDVFATERNYAAIRINVVYKNGNMATVKVPGAEYEYLEKA